MTQSVLTYKVFLSTAAHLYASSIARRQFGACRGEFAFQNGGTMKTRRTPSQRQNAGSRTLAIHAGEPKKHGVGAAVGTEICRTANFTFSSTAEMKRWAEGKRSAYIYTPYANPHLAWAEAQVPVIERPE